MSNQRDRVPVFDRLGLTLKTKTSRWEVDAFSCLLPFSEQCAWEWDETPREKDILRGDLYVYKFDRLTSRDVTIRMSMGHLNFIDIFAPAKLIAFLIPATKN